MRLACLLLAANLAGAEEPVRILVSYQSDTGNTAKLAEAVRKGAAAVAGVSVTLKKAGEVSDPEITGYDGIAFGAPVHWQTASAEAKRFLDRVAAAFWNAKLTGDGRTAGVF